MFKPSTLCGFAICQRCLLMMALWTGLLVGAVELYRITQAEQAAQSGIERLAIYGVVLRFSQAVD